MGPVEWGLIVLLSIIWGGAFFFTEIALEEVTPFGIVFARVGGAALTLYLVLKLLGLSLPHTLSGWMPYLVMGFLNNAVPFCLIVWGQVHIASGLASILNATTPLFTVLIAHLLTEDERLTMSKLAGVVTGFAGVAVMLGSDLLLGLGDQVFAQLAILGAAVSYSFAGLYGRRFKGQNPIITATGQVTASTVLLLPLAIASGGFGLLLTASGTVWATLIGVATLCTALAYLIYFRILRTAGATNLMLVTFLIPVSAILLGVLFLGETLETRHMIGMLLIGGGLILIDGRLVIAKRKEA